MKTSFAVVLAALLCVERVSSLMCFHCDNAENNWGCMSVKTCSDADNYCITKYLGGGMGENHKQSISKGCSPICPEGGIDLGLMAFSVKCCKTSLCNTSGAVSVKSSTLMLAVGALLSLFYILGAKL
ncbi:lymphocyte antigen 6E-like [Hemicordylus capensis]|uniref:lymphocyte antigen 6E-like n=1 Tax=Hemicordylus capensis TaxID=884348 RepID=UPI002304C621|nr:lymphocyte antigen 6E-like [Hemicordylus capensis]